MQAYEDNGEPWWPQAQCKTLSAMENHGAIGAMQALECNGKHGAIGAMQDHRSKGDSSVLGLSYFNLGQQLYGAMAQQNVWMDAQAADGLCFLLLAQDVRPMACGLWHTAKGWCCELW